LAFFFLIVFGYLCCVFIST